MSQVRENSPGHCRCQGLAPGLDLWTVAYVTPEQRAFGKSSAVEIDSRRQQGQGGFYVLRIGLAVLPVVRQTQMLRDEQIGFWSRVAQCIEYGLAVPGIRGVGIRAHMPWLCKMRARPGSRSHAGPPHPENLASVPAASIRAPDSGPLARVLPQASPNT